MKLAFVALALLAASCASSSNKAPATPVSAPATDEPDGLDNGEPGPDADEAAIREAADAGEGAVEYGRFVRTELRSVAPERAARFYQQLFGWTVEDTGGDRVVRNQGAEIARLVADSKDTRKDGVPAGWTSWIAVLDLEELERDVPANGGRIVRAPRDSTQGRSAVLAGPTGGVFGAVEWTTRAEPPREPVDGDFALAQLWTNRFDEAVSFYVVVGGYTTVEATYGKDRYSVLVADGVPRALIRKTPPGRANRWIPFVQVADAAATAKKARSLGATLVTPPRELTGVGTLAVIADPTGAVIGVVQPSRADGGGEDDEL